MNSNSETKEIRVNFDKHSPLATLCAKCKADPTETLCPSCVSVAQNLCFSCVRVTDYPTTKRMIEQCGYRIFDDAGNLCWPCPCFKAHEGETVLAVEAGGVVVQDVLEDHFAESKKARALVEADEQNRYDADIEKVAEEALERSLDRAEFRAAQKDNPELEWESWLEQRNACKHRSAPEPESLMSDDKVSALRRAIAQAREEALCQKEAELHLCYAEQTVPYAQKLVVKTQVDYLRFWQPKNERGLDDIEEAKRCA